MHPRKLGFELSQAFTHLNDKKIRYLARYAPPVEELSDADLAALVFGFLAAGEKERADQFLRALRGDGTALPGDVAYIRAFRREVEGDDAGVVEELRAHLDEPATHEHVLRLRLADALIRLKRYDEIEEALRPVLAPPGVADTLEAFLILMEANLKTRAPQQTLVEIAAHIDVLLERGFVLAKAPNAVYYTRLLHENRIEGIVPRMLKAHERLFADLETDSQEDILFLLAAGNEHKVPGAVYAAGRNYARKPFRWSGIDPEGAAYVLSSHEEAEAARLTLLTCFPKNRIAKDPAIWGPLMVSSYLAEKWSAALELAQEHRHDLVGSELEENATALRAVCEAMVGRHREALTRIDSLGDVFFENTHGYEAGCAATALIKTRSWEKLGQWTRHMYAMEREPENFNEYLNRITLDMLIAGDAESWSKWLDILFETLEESQREQMVLTLGTMAFEWGWTEGLGPAVSVLERAGSGHVTILRALDAFLEGDGAAALERVGTTDLSDPDWRIEIPRLRILRRFGRHREAIEEINRILEEEIFVPPAVLAMKMGLLEETEQFDLVGDVSIQLKRAIENAGKQGIQTEPLRFETRLFREGDTSAASLLLARELNEFNPGNEEVLRLALRARRAFDASPAQREEAEEMIEGWKRRHR